MNRKVISLLAALVLAMPLFASVLCISPDGHVAIEGLNADCCVSKDHPGFEAPSQNSALGAHDECLNCTDLPLLSNESGTIRRGYASTAASASASESRQNILEMFASSGGLLLKGYPALLMSPPTSSSVPLRC